MFVYPGHLYNYGSRGKTSPARSVYVSLKTLEARHLPLSSPCYPRATVCPRFVTTAPWGASRHLQRLATDAVSLILFFICLPEKRVPTNSLCLAPETLSPVFLSFHFDKEPSSAGGPEKAGEQHHPPLYTSCLQQTEVVQAPLETTETCRDDPKRNGTGR